MTRAFRGRVLSLVVLLIPFGLVDPSGASATSVEVLVAVQTGLNPQIDQKSDPVSVADSIGIPRATFASSEAMLGGPLKAFATAVSGAGASAHSTMADRFTTTALGPPGLQGFLGVLVSLSGAITEPFPGLGIGDVNFDIGNSNIPGSGGHCDAMLTVSGSVSCLAVVPIVFNQPSTFTFVFMLDAIAGSPSTGEVVTTDVSRSASISEIQLLDPNMQFVRDITVTDDAGFQYPVGAGPGPHGVPEPGTLFLVSAALAGLAIATRRWYSPR